jgi:hypothetical protein
LFFQLTQASFQISQLGGRDALTTPWCAALYPVLGLLNVTLETLQLRPQLIQGGSSPCQVAPCLSLSFLKLGDALSDILQT